MSSSESQTEYERMRPYIYYAAIGLAAFGMIFLTTILLCILSMRKKRSSRDEFGLQNVPSRSSSKSKADGKKDGTSTQGSLNSTALLYSPGKVEEEPVAAKPTRSSGGSEKNNNTVTYEVELKLVQNVGSGYYGNVWKGEWRAITCAVKVLDKSRFTEVQMQQFLKEAEFLKTMPANPNVVRFRGVCPEPLCFATDYCEQGSLRTYIDSLTTDIEIPQCIDILLDIAKGMAYLGKNNILHKNLAARNVILVPQTENTTGFKYIAKIGDYGMSALFENVIDLETGQVNGRLPHLKWIPPEGFDKPHLYNSKSDVWSFAVTAVELLSRRIPYSDISDEEFASNWRELQLKAHSYLPPAIPNQLSLLLRECLEIENASRPEFSYICFQLESLKKYVQMRSLRGNRASVQLK